MCATEHPNVKAVIDNLKKPMPLVKRISLTLKNSVIKIVRFQNCCGHPGESGC
jgi:hypothetical protein